MTSTCLNLTIELCQKCSQNFGETFEDSCKKILKPFEAELNYWKGHEEFFKRRLATLRLIVGQPGKLRKDIDDLKAKMQK